MGEKQVCARHIQIRAQFVLKFVTVNGNVIV
jgi:hypothetical protein